jgi:hypothetical protein
VESGLSGARRTLPASSIPVIVPKPMESAGKKPNASIPPAASSPSSFGQEESARGDSCPFLKWTNTTCSDFDRQAFLRAHLNSIEIPARATVLGEKLFADLKQLESVTFESGSQLERIEENSFRGSGLRAIVLPSSLTDLAAGSFQDCASLRSVVFENGSRLDKIGASAFEASCMREIKIPSALRILGARSFRECKALHSVEFADGSGLEEIRDKAFQRSGLDSIQLPMGLRVVGDSAFAATRLTMIGIPRSLQYLGAHAFEYCVSLRVVTFDEDSQLKAIGDRAFYGSGLTRIDIPPSVDSLGAESFYDCKSLKKVKAPGCQADANEFWYAFEKGLGFRLVRGAVWSRFVRHGVRPALSVGAAAAESVGGLIPGRGGAALTAAAGAFREVLAP